MQQLYPFPSELNRVLVLMESSVKDHIKFNNAELRRLELQLNQEALVLQRSKARLQIAYENLTNLRSQFRKATRGNIFPDWHIDSTEPILRASKSHLQDNYLKNDFMLSNTINRSVALQNQQSGDISFCIKPWGTIYSGFSKRFEAPRQPFIGPAGNAVIFLHSSESISFDHNRPKKAQPESMNKDIFQHLKENPSKKMWVLYWFDRNKQWREYIRPPRRKNERIGVFATRSPNRPSPVGLTLCKIEKIDVENMKIFVSGVDILDETPLLGLKPYVCDKECFKDIISGWLDDLGNLQPLYYDNDDESSFAESYAVGEFNSRVQEQIEFIDQRSSIDIKNLIVSNLSKNPFSRGTTSEIECDCRLQDSSFPRYLAVGAYRVHFTIDIEKKRVQVNEITSGIRKEVLESDANYDPEILEHLNFIKTFKSSRDDSTTM